MSQESMKVRISAELRRIDSTLDFSNSYDEDGLVKYILSETDKAREEGAKHVAEWIRAYARRVCLNDTMKNERPRDSEMILSDALIVQALETIRQGSSKE